MGATTDTVDGSGAVGPSSSRCPRPEARPVRARVRRLSCDVGENCAIREYDCQACPPDDDEDDDHGGGGDNGEDEDDHGGGHGGDDDEGEGG